MKYLNAGVTIEQLINVFLATPFGEWLLLSLLTAIGLAALVALRRQRFLGR